MNPYKDVDIKEVYKLHFPNAHMNDKSSSEDDSEPDNDEFRPVSILSAYNNDTVQFCSATRRNELPPQAKKPQKKTQRKPSAKLKDAPKRINKVIKKVDKNKKKVDRKKRKVVEETIEDSLCDKNSYSVLFTDDEFIKKDESVINNVPLKCDKVVNGNGVESNGNIQNQAVEGIVNKQNKMINGNAVEGKQNQIKANTDALKCNDATRCNNEEAVGGVKKKKKKTLNSKIADVNVSNTNVESIKVESTAKGIKKKTKTRDYTKITHKGEIIYPKISISINQKETEIGSMKITQSKKIKLLDSSGNLQEVVSVAYSSSTGVDQPIGGPMIRQETKLMRNNIGKLGETQSNSSEVGNNSTELERRQFEEFFIQNNLNKLKKRDYEEFVRNMFPVVSIPGMDAPKEHAHRNMKKFLTPQDPLQELNHLLQSNAKGSDQKIDEIPHCWRAQHEILRNTTNHWNSDADKLVKTYFEKKKTRIISNESNNKAKCPSNSKDDTENTNNNASASEQQENETKETFVDMSFYSDDINPGCFSPKCNPQQSKIIHRKNLNQTTEEKNKTEQQLRTEYVANILYGKDLSESSMNDESAEILATQFLCGALSLEEIWYFKMGQESYLHCLKSKDNKKRTLQHGESSKDLPDESYIDLLLMQYIHGTIDIDEMVTVFESRIEKNKEWPSIKIEEENKTDYFNMHCTLYDYPCDNWYTFVNGDLIRFSGDFLITW